MVLLLIMSLSDAGALGSEGAAVMESGEGEGGECGRA